MKGLFPTMLAVLFGLAFEEFYAETAMPQEGWLRILSAIPITLVPLLFVEALLLHARQSLRAGKAFDVQKYSKYVAAAPLPLYLLIVFLCRWPTILVPLGLEGVVLFDHLIVLLPFFTIHLICVIESTRLRRPIYVQDGVVRTVRLREILPTVRDHLRHLGLVLAPLLALVLILDLVNDTELRVYFRKIPLVALAFLFVLFGLLTLIFPELFRVSMNLKQLVAGAPLKLRLEELSQRLGFKCKEVLYWPTSRPVFNALIVGVVPRFRYVILTEELCKRLTLDEICAVFAHEVGHGKRQHALFYVLLSATFLALLLPVGDFVGQEISYLTAGRLDPTLSTTLFAYVPAFVVYWKLLLDALSKRFELESDVYGVESIRDPVLFISTLEKVARLARLERGKAPMRHFSIEGRVDFLRRAFVDREAAPLEKFRSQIRRIRKSIAISAAVVICVAGLLIGYQSLHGYASILLDRGEVDRAANLLAKMIDLRANDVVALSLLSEAELYRGVDADAAPSDWAKVLAKKTEMRPSEQGELIEELRAAWARAVLRNRPEIGGEMLDRMASVNARDRDEALHFDPYLEEQIAELRRATSALSRQDGLELERIVHENPRWLRRPDMRHVERHLLRVLEDRK